MPEMEQMAHMAALRAGQIIQQQACQTALTARLSHQAAQLHVLAALEQNSREGLAFLIFEN